MKAMKGKLYKKIKSIKPITYLKPDRILQVNAAAESFFESFITTTKPETDQTIDKNDTQLPSESKEIEVIDVAELMKDLEEEEENKENYIEREEKTELFKKPVLEPLSEIDVSCFRRPDMNSGTLFDPNLLAAFEEAVNQHIKITQEARNSRIEEEDQEETEPPNKSRRIEEDNSNSNPLLQFEERCPPGGEDSVIIYTTTLRGIRKTFEDCASVRFLLETFRVIFFERDISMHMEFKEELHRLMEDHQLKEDNIVPPRLFIKGRYIGGASEILRLHEQGKFKILFGEIPIDYQFNVPCESCAGVRFVICSKCNGSHKIVDDQGVSSECVQCNENGLIVCPLCC